MKIHYTYQRAFTLVELIVIVGLAGLWAAWLIPGFAKARLDTQSCYCQNNLRQLAVAWRLYAEENGDKLVQNFNGSDASGGYEALTYPQTYAGWAQGYVDWSSNPENTNTALLVDEKYSKMAKYFNRSSSIYNCPADRYLSPPQVAAGFTHRARSYSLSMCLGDGNAQSGPFGPIYRQCKKMSDLLYPAPGETFTFIEEHPDSINDPEFFCPEIPSAWADVPATTHGGGTTFAFADGHTEVHQWTGSLTTRRAVEVLYSDDISGIGVGATDPDLGWVVYHSSRSRPTWPAGWPMSR